MGEIRNPRWANWTGVITSVISLSAITIALIGG
jgi:hypothetical protein